jgi:Tol biopolymer transport system component/DNA-binding winged helix-turn-helix (wHTH) protein
MGNPGESSQCIGFGEFELDLRTREVWGDGGKFDLQEQPFQVLTILLERPGELVTREELTKRLWPADTFVDFEHSLNSVIKRLREALHDSAEQPRLIETLPRRGYRLIAPVRQISCPAQNRVDAFSAGSVHQYLSAEKKGARSASVPIPRLAEFVNPPIGRLLWHRRAAFLFVALVLGCLAGWLTYFLLSPTPALRVIRSTKIATSIRLDPWGLLVSDGTRVYFLERNGEHWNLAQTSINGGDAQIVPTPFRNTRVLAVSPERDKLLIGTFISRADRMPYWIWPVQGGAPKRVGEASGYDAAWTPDGRQIIYGQDDGVYVIEADGSNVHKFVSTDGRPGRFAWSRDGRTLRFTLTSLHGESVGLWQVDSDGAHLHSLLPGWSDLPNECCGFWSPEGDYFFFVSAHARSMDIWAIREKASLLHRRQSEPFRLTTGPSDIYFVTASTDGRKLLALGGNERDEFERYDLQKRQFTPLPFTTPAFHVSYSRDGAWMAYVASTDSVLTMSKPDGTQPMALTPPGLRAAAISWSPDANQLAVEAQKPDGSYRIFMISTEGGMPREIAPDTRKEAEPSWSPDGKLIAFSRFKNELDESASIQVFNVASNEVSALPRSAGLRAPHWSPDGRFLAVITEDLHTVKLLDLRTQKWTDLAKAVFLNGALCWSKDGKELYYQDVLDTNQPIFKIRMRDRKREFVTNAEPFLRSGTQRMLLSGLAPDGSLIVKLDRGGADIYALDVDIR